MAKNTYGTGCFMLHNTGTHAVPSIESPAHHRRLAHRRQHRIRARRQRLHRRRGRAMAARRPRHHSQLGEVEAARRQRRRTTAASISCPLLPAWARRIGTPTPRGSIFGLTRGTTAGPHRPRRARRHRLSDRRPARRHGAATPASRSKNFASMAALPPTTSSCNSKPTCSACR